MDDMIPPDPDAFARIERQLADATIKEAQLQADHDQLKQMIACAPFGYQSLDENGCFIDVNQTWLDLLGYVREEVIGKSFSEFLHPD